MSANPSAEIPDAGNAGKSLSEMESSTASGESSASASASEASEGSAEVIGRGISSMLETLVRAFDDQAESAGRSQEQLSLAIDRLTRELDQLLEDAPLPFIMQHAAKISGLCKRVSSLNTILKTIQRRIDNIDKLFSLGSSQGGKSESSSKDKDSIKEDPTNGSLTFFKSKGHEVAPGSENGKVNRNRVPDEDLLGKLTEATWEK